MSESSRPSGEVAFMFFAGMSIGVIMTVLGFVMYFESCDKHNSELARFMENVTSVKVVDWSFGDGKSNVVVENDDGQRRTTPYNSDVVMPVRGEVWQVRTKRRAGYDYIYFVRRMNK